MAEQTAVETPVEVNSQTLLGGEEVEQKTAENTLLATEEEASTEEKTVEEVKKEEVPVPEKYEFKVPEGMEVDTALVDQFTPIFKELKLNTEQVQKLVDVYAPYVKQRTEAAQKEALDFHDKQKEDWGKETIKILGAKTKESLAASAKFINTYAENKEEAQQIREMLNISGLGNYPPFVKMIVKAGSRLREDSFVEPNKATTLDAEKNPAKYLYNSV